jgi:hypothetical protein
MEETLQSGLNADKGIPEREKERDSEREREREREKDFLFQGRGARQG